MCFAFKAIINRSLLIFSQQHQQTLLNQLREVTGTTDIQLLQQALQVRHPSVNLSNSPADLKSGCCGSCSSSGHFIAPYSVCSSISGTPKCSQVLILRISALCLNTVGLECYKKHICSFFCRYFHQNLVNYVGISVLLSCALLPFEGSSSKWTNWHNHLSNCHFQMGVKLHWAVLLAAPIDERRWTRVGLVYWTVVAESMIKRQYQCWCQYWSNWFHSFVDTQISLSTSRLIDFKSIIMGHINVEHCVGVQIFMGPTVESPPPSLQPTTKPFNPPGPAWYALYIASLLQSHKAF